MCVYNTAYIIILMQKCCTTIVIWIYILTRMVRSTSAISVYAACMADKYAAEGLTGAYSSNHHIRVVEWRKMCVVKWKKIKCVL